MKLTKEEVNTVTIGLMERSDFTFIKKVTKTDIRRRRSLVLNKISL